ncbi:hypothetical protein Rs2_24169 [Raphanus sativus]|nr:hypothetical protein Rs2_24169 [Raphanus sativus]
MRITTIRFNTDCTDLVDMITNPEEWPAFATEIGIFRSLQDDFEDVRLSHIPRNMNGRTDVSSKRSKKERLHLFPYRSDPVRWRGSSETRLVGPPFDLMKMGS